MAVEEVGVYGAGMANADSTAPFGVYLLQPKPGVQCDHDQVRLFVVRAPDERHARLLAGNHAGAEDDHFWFDENRSTCVRIDDGTAWEVLVREVVA